jgi:hypothetical protein
LQSFSDNKARSKKRGYKSYDDLIKLFNATENLPILHPRHVQIQHWMNGRDKRREAIKHDFTRLKSLEEGSEAYKNLAILKRIAHLDAK